MAYCGPRGIPRSVFLGRVWPNPADPTEPQWLSDDFDAAMDWMEYEDNKCVGCGMHRDECMSDDPPDYVAHPVVCWACQERDVRAKQHAESGGSQAGVYVVVEQEGDAGGS
jgi:hypothetical protein